MARRVFFVLAALVAAYGGLVLRPQVLFAYETRAGNVVLHARAPLPPRASAIAEEVRRRVMRSPLYVPQDDYDVFLCDTSALFALYARLDYRVGGTADVYLTRNTFLRPSRIERDRLVAYSGLEPSGDRTLTYFITHEITHIMIARHLGRRAHYRLSVWQREGYADYVAKGETFDFPAVLRDFRANTPSLDPRRSGLYLR